jgi:hypothetical protein
MNYTFSGNPDAEFVIALHQQLITEHVLKVVPVKQLAAIVMIGGYGRSEGAYIETEAGCRPYNDYDYFLVFRNTSKRQSKLMTRKIPNLEALVGIEVDFFPLRESMLPKMEFSLMNAEMLAGHRVIWGDQNILKMMPEMKLDNISPAELIRLMTNRGCLLLMNRLGRAGGEYSKFINKAWLAIGDVVIANAGRYCLSYVEKKSLIAEVCQDAVLVERYQRAVDIRLRPDLYVEWQAWDMDEVCRYWVAILESLIRKGRQISWRQRMKNILNNLGDPRVWRMDRLILEHPRVRVTMLLKEAISNLQPNVTNENELLGLWASYS